MHGQPPFLPSCTHPNQPLSGPMKRSFPFPLSTVFEHSCCTQLLQTTLWNLHTITPKLLENGGNHLIYSYIKQSSYRESCLKAKHNSTSHSQKTKATSGLFLLSCYVSLYLQHCNLIATSQSGDGTTGPQPQPTKSKVFCLIKLILAITSWIDSQGPCEVKSCEQQEISTHNLGPPPHLLSTIQEQSLGAVMYTCSSMAVATAAFLFLYAWNAV